ncbi:META domain-containing protein [Acidovorax sp. NCPPB 2350]|nr:META domain-containing protein [Acidovorax sp. NCPPB 2350]
MTRAMRCAPAAGTGWARRRAGGALLLAAALLAVGCSVLPPPPDAVVTGTAFSRQRFYLPSGGAFEAVLLDVSDADAPPTVVGRQAIDGFERLPVELRIPYRASRVVAGGRYVVRATVSVNGIAWLSSEGVHPLQRDPAFRHVDVLLQPVPRNAATARGMVPLAQTYWKLVEVDGLALPPAPAGRPDAHLILQPEEGRAMGSGGCNRFVGDYRVDGVRLQFGAIESGLQLCLDTGLAEGLYLEALRATQRFRIEGRQLILLAGGGEDERATLRFEAPELAASGR